MATAALFYAAARYKKVDGLTSAASRIGIAAVVQGVSQKTHAPLGERTKISWLADGISLGLVAYGMSYTDLAKRTKYLAGAALFGSQLVISNLKPNTALARIDKIETKEECDEVYEELTLLFDENKETITPQQGIKTCKAFFEKAHPFSRDSWQESPASQVLNVYSGFLNELQGWEKVKAQMEYMEVINAVGFFDFSFNGSEYFTELLEEGEKVQFDLWMEKTGMFIRLRCLTCQMNNTEYQFSIKIGISARHGEHQDAQTLTTAIFPGLKIKVLPLKVIPDRAGAAIRAVSSIKVTAPLPSIKLSSGLELPPPQALNEIAIKVANTIDEVFRI